MVNALSRRWVDDCTMNAVFLHDRLAYTWYNNTLATFIVRSNVVRPNTLILYNLFDETIHRLYKLWSETIIYSTEAKFINIYDFLLFFGTIHFSEIVWAFVCFVYLCDGLFVSVYVCVSCLCVSECVCISVLVWESVVFLVSLCESMGVYFM